MNWKAGSYCLHLYCALTDTKPHFQAELQFVSFQKRSTIISKPPFQSFLHKLLRQAGVSFLIVCGVDRLTLRTNGGARGVGGWDNFLHVFAFLHYWTVLVILKVVGLLHCGGAGKTIIDGGDKLDI